MGQNGGLYEGKGGEAHKVHLLDPKGSLLGGPAPTQNRSWLRACNTPMCSDYTWGGKVQNVKKGNIPVIKLVKY